MQEGGAGTPGRSVSCTWVRVELDRPSRVEVTEELRFLGSMKYLIWCSYPCNSKFNEVS